MLDFLKGINFTDPKVYVPLIVGVVVLALVAWLAKKVLKFALIAVIVGLALMLFNSAPSFKVDGTTAILTLKGVEYSINVKDVRVVEEVVDGETKKYLVSGTTKIELPFSTDFIKKFILDKINKTE